MSVHRTHRNHVVIAWDGGREASRALADALPILVRARKVTIACLDPSASARGADAVARNRLVAYLRRQASPRASNPTISTKPISV